MRQLNSMRHWTTGNKIRLNLSKTLEMLIRSKTTNPDPQSVPCIERKSWLTLLGITFQENPRCWDLHVDKLIAKASSGLYCHINGLQVPWLFSRPTQQVI